MTSTSRRRAAVVGLAVVATVGVTACGNNATSDSSATSATTTILHLDDELTLDDLDTVGLDDSVDGVLEVY